MFEFGDTSIRKSFQELNELLYFHGTTMIFKVTAFCLYCVKTCKSRALYMICASSLLGLHIGRMGGENFKRLRKAYGMHKVEILTVATDPETMKNSKDSITSSLDIGCAE